MVNDNKAIEIDMQAECLPAHEWEADPARDDFDATRLAPKWNFLRNPHAEDWSLTERPGWLRLHGSAITLNDVDTPAFVGRRQQHMTCKISVRLDFMPQREGDEAGLTLRANEQHHCEIAVTLRNGMRCIIVRRRIGDLSAEVVQESISDGLINLQIAANALQYSFAYALNGITSRELATATSRYLSTEVAGGFTGVYIGMYATGNGQTASTTADFDWFDYQPS